MNAPKHHFPDEVLLDYAAGNTVEAVSLAIACHASMCADCRRQVALFERISGALVESAAPAALSADALQRALARLDEAEVKPAQPAKAAPLPGFGFVPRPLWPYLPPAGAAALTEVVPGISAIALGVAPRSGAARLVQLDPAIVIPQHDHGGPEYGVLFQGGLREGDELFHRGDVFYMTPGDVHIQEVLPGERCVALVVNEGSLVPLTEAGAALLKLFG